MPESLPPVERVRPGIWSVPVPPENAATTVPSVVLLHEASVSVRDSESAAG